MRVEAVKVAVYSLSAALAGVAGVLQFAKLSVGDPTVAVGLELDVIAAVIIGGQPGRRPRHRARHRASVRPSLSVVAIGCSQHGLANWVQQIVTGAIIVLAVALDRCARSRGLSRRRPATSRSHRDIGLLLVRLALVVAARLPSAARAFSTR